MFLFIFYISFLGRGGEMPSDHVLFYIYLFSNEFLIFQILTGIFG